MIDNSELNNILEILEKYEDVNEAEAIKLLSEFNAASKELGILIRNLDDSLDHLEWKELCDKAQMRINEIVKVIKNLDC